MFFFVAKVDQSKVKHVDGRAILSPLRFYYDTEAFSLPIRLGLLNNNGPQDLIINIIARDQRYEIANRPNITIPSNIELVKETRRYFSEFYAALFDATLKKFPGAAVTEYSWSWLALSKAGKCDPCPTESRLTLPDLGAFGFDVIPDLFNSTITLTRLHVRLEPSQPQDDLIFRAAPPIVGGRERYLSTPDEERSLEKSARPAKSNQFQARYIIRHRWTAPIECEEPKPGRWSREKRSPNSPQVATDTAFTSRGIHPLSKFILENIDELGVEPLKSPAPPTKP